MGSAKLLDKDGAKLLAKRLENHYRGAKYYLDFGSPIDLLVAAILSAQTRDEVVNRLTPKLFSRYKAAGDYAMADEQELIGYIRSSSFAGNKARNIIKACTIIRDEHGGKVPDSMEALTMLPGIGRKTANTILINAYGIISGIPVDTWVIKLSYRLGLSQNKDPDKIEADLKAEIPKDYWHNFAYVLKAHGKSICGAVPICSKCPVNGICPMNGVDKRS